MSVSFFHQCVVRPILRSLVIGLSSAALLGGMVAEAEAAQARKARSSALSLAKARVSKSRRAEAPEPVSYGRRSGLHSTHDSLSLRSSVALVLDQNSSEILYSKNADAVLPIASLTKLMTALVVVEAQLSMDDVLEVTEEDVDNEKHSRSRLGVGTRLSRGDMLHLALMSSENRAASALGRHYPGGTSAFVTAMNQKAAQLGMLDTTYVEPTGLSSRNQSSSIDLARLVLAAHQQPLIRDLSTSRGHDVQVGRRLQRFMNTNTLVRNPNSGWDIGLQKTGYIAEAGRCLVMQARIAGRNIIMVFLDSAGKNSRFADAERVRRWIQSIPARRDDMGGTIPTGSGPSS